MTGKRKIQTTYYKFIHYKKPFPQFNLLLTFSNPAFYLWLKYLPLDHLLLKNNILNI
jgi:hypothetical protein